MKYLELATRVAKANSLPGKDKHFLFGAVCLREDGAIVVSSNIRTQDRLGMAHAEARALRKGGQGSTLWVVRINRLGQWAMAKPCPQCQNLIRHKKTKRVYYTVGVDTYSVWNP
jgi:tRNA(Arg) A34 adenosine deaminase TadA